MFTGLVQALGTLTQSEEELWEITCVGESGKQIVEDLALGDSVAVDGVCLTVTAILPSGFTAIASPETLRRTILGQSTNSYVNLETSLRAGSKLGGHFVTGHIDGWGCLIGIESSGNSWEITFAKPPENFSFWQNYISPYLVSKGSIAVNGISLTIADCDREGNWFQVAVIPHTYQETNLHDLQVGSLVNIEVDILGKYVAKFLQSGRDSLDNFSPEITPDFLAEHGYF